MTLSQEILAVVNPTIAAASAIVEMCPMEIMNDTSHDDALFKYVYAATLTPIEMYAEK